MKRKKISTTPPKKDKETPAKEENSFLVGLMKKHDISYDQALKMAIQMDAEKDIFDVAKINLLLQLKGLDDLSLFNMISGKSGGHSGCYIGRIAKGFDFLGYSFEPKGLSIAPMIYNDRVIEVLNTT